MHFIVSFGMKFRSEKSALGVVFPDIARAFFLSLSVDEIPYGIYKSLKLKLTSGACNEQ